MSDRKYCDTITCVRESQFKFRIRVLDGNVKTCFLCHPCAQRYLQSEVKSLMSFDVIYTDIKPRIVPPPPPRPIDTTNINIREG